MDPVNAFRISAAAQRDSGIRIDRQGDLWHDGQRVTHPGFRAALFAWLDRLPPPDARYILRLDKDRFAFIEVDDTPLVVKTLRFVEKEGSSVVLWLSLSDGHEERCDTNTLNIDAQETLRVKVRQGTLEARLSTSAVMPLLPFLQRQSNEWQLALPGQPAATLGRR